MSWFSNITRKFESVCEDVDQVFNHESMKYIERKVQNVGENVMKLYSTLAEVVVSPIMSEDEEEENASVISYLKSLIGGIDEEHFVDNPMPLPSQNQLVHKSADDYEESGFAFGDSATTEHFSPTSSSASGSDVDCSLAAIRCNEIGISCMLPNKAFAFYYTTALHNDTIKGNYDYITFASSIQSFGSLDDYSSCESTTDFNKEPNHYLSHQLEPEDSFVIVDYPTPHVDVSTGSPNQPSYKRTILNALSSKKRLAREYRELAILQGHNATKCCQGTSLAASHTMLLRDSQTIQSSDSDWELI